MASPKGNPLPTYLKLIIQAIAIAWPSQWASKPGDFNNPFKFHVHAGILSLWRWIYKGMCFGATGNQNLELVVELLHNCSTVVHNLEIVYVLNELNVPAMFSLL